MAAGFVFWFCAHTFPTCPVSGFISGLVSRLGVFGNVPCFAPAKTARRLCLCGSRLIQFLLSDSTGLYGGYATGTFSLRATLRCGLGRRTAAAGRFRDSRSRREAPTRTLESLPFQTNKPRRLFRHTEQCLNYPIVLVRTALQCCPTVDLVTTQCCPPALCLV